MAVEQLIEDLKKGSGLKRAQAAAELGKLKDKKACDALIAALEDQNAGVRNNAAFALCELGSREAIPHLMRALREDPEEWVRKSSAKALGILRAPEAVSSLKKALDDPSPIVRKNAVRSLGQIGGQEALQSLERAASSLDSAVSKAAREFLEKNRSAGAKS